MTTNIGNTDSPKAWAHRIVARHDAGKKINPAVLAMARRALGIPTEQ
jgi:hypothetical protein